MLLVVQKCRSIHDRPPSNHCEVYGDPLCTQVFYHADVLASRSSREAHIQ